MDRTEAARLAGLERQALRDAVTGYNAEGVSGLFNRPRGRRPEWLTESEHPEPSDPGEGRGADFP